MTTLNDMADTLIGLLADKATAPNAISPYMTQRDLMDALDIRSTGTMSDVVTRAALRVTDAGYPGYAILHSKETGYRLGDSYTVQEIKTEQTRLKTVHTKVIRSASAMLVSGAGSQSRMIGRQLTQIASVVIIPAIEAIDEIITA